MKATRVRSKTIHFTWLASVELNSDMPEDSRKSDDVEKLLSEEMSLEERKKTLIAALLEKREDCGDRRAVS